MTPSNNKNNGKHISREPFTHFIQKMDRLFSERPVKGVLQSLDDFFMSAGERSFPTELHDKKSFYLITASLPGIRREQIEIELLPQAVSISIRHNQSEELEHDFQPFFPKKQKSNLITKTIALPNPINDQKITASHRDGILQLKLPKLKGNKVEIND